MRENATEGESLAGEHIQIWFFSSLYPDISGFVCLSNPFSGRWGELSSQFDHGQMRRDERSKPAENHPATGEIGQYVGFPFSV
jgi:hypothetical protein